MRKPLLNNSPAAGIMFFLLAFLCPLIFEQPALLAQEKKPPEYDQQITDFSLAGFQEKGKKSWDISGKSADMSPQVVTLNDIVGNMYGEKEDVKLTADRGDFDKSEGRLHLENNVVITTSSGAKMTTDSLDWDRQKQIVSTLDKVNIEKENMVASGEGATGQPDLNKMSLEKAVQVEINNSKGPLKTEEALKNKITITCDGPLEINYQRNIGIFNNNVKVETSDATINSDIMEVYFLAGKKEEKRQPPANAAFMGTSIEKIIARGNVKISRGENVSYSDEAVYNASDRKITLSGKPRLVIYSAEGINNASFGN